MSLNMGVGWERTDAESPEERACFGMFTISAGQLYLTEGYDEYVNRLRAGPLVSAYHAAEWFAWNWWRLRWEPRTSQSDWPFSHRMTTIGHGYVWPNITIHSDGARVVLVAKPSTRVNAKPFRYIADRVVVIPALQFETTLSNFINVVIDRLAEEGIEETNLNRLWADLTSERADPDLSLRRRLEALAGVEPDEDNPSINKLIAESSEVGSDAVAELAAEAGARQRFHTIADLWAQAELEGYEAHAKNAVQLREFGWRPSISEAPAWKRGAEAARLLREQENLGVAPIHNKRLEELAGVKSGIIGDTTKRADLSFLIQEKGNGRVALHSGYETGRRFQLARLLGDETAMPGTSCNLATSAHTYRQKLQRSFAAEFLCPFDALLDELKGDYSTEAQTEVAGIFSVSERTVVTLLVNNNILDRDEMFDDEAAH